MESRRPDPDEEAALTTSRKKDHVDIVLEKDIRAKRNAWEDVTLLHDALPEVNLPALDVSTEFLGAALGAPLMIASMTGGYPDAERINGRLAAAAAHHGLALGVGSQRAALKDASTERSYTVVRDHDVPFVAANIGAPQLIPQGDAAPLTRDEIDALVSMIEADALIVHLNFLQEAVQPEGDLDAEGCEAAIRDLANDLGVPVVAKETGAGIGRDAAKRLVAAGVDAIDVGGLSGTSFAAVELVRAEAEEMEGRTRIGRLYRDWGIPTPVSVLECQVGVPVVATGGLRSGLDVARGLALGAQLGGMASAGLHAADRGEKEAIQVFGHVIDELKTAMFLTGARRPEDLAMAPVVVTGHTAEWMERMGHDPRGLGAGRS